MARVIGDGGGGGGGGYNPPVVNKNTGNKSTNPSIITSSGGLTGSAGLLMTPYYDTMQQKSLILVHDASNFDCEEDAEYDFRQEIPGTPPQEGRNVTCHLIILKYRELGNCTFNVNVTVFQKTNDTFNTIQIPVKVSNVYKRKIYPDKKIHTVFLSFEITGERPQVTITRNANSGPVAVTSLTLCGNADEMPQV